jgi:ATP-dependent helicase/DNAse subunit B
MQLEKQPTWEVQDATKIQAYMNCPRRYFYEYVLGWRAERKNVHLEFGNGWHVAMETLLNEGYHTDAVARAFAHLAEYYYQHQGWWCK